MSGTSCDGSAPADARDRVEIDPTDDSDRWRYVCPNGHHNWDRTNNHIWCQSCRRQIEAGEDVDAEHYHLVDKRTGEEISWSAIVIAEPRVV
jgi:hypothetical protein